MTTEVLGSPRLGNKRQWSYADTDASNPSKPIVSKAIHASGIPAMIDHLHPHSFGKLKWLPPKVASALSGVRWGWVLPWLVAMLSLIVVAVGYGKEYHRTIWMELPADADVSIFAKGCDIQMQPNKYSKSLVKVSWWKTLGDASVTVNGTKVQVNAVSQRRSVTWKCVVSLFPNDKKGLINSLKLKVDPSNAAAFNVGPSNVAEVVSIDLEKAIIKSDLTLDVNTYSETKIVGAQVPVLAASIVGGVFSLHEAASNDPKHPIWMEEEYKTVIHVPKSINLNLKAATVILNTHNVDMRVQLAQDTVDDGILAGARVKNIGENVYEVLRSSQTAGPYVGVTLEADDCAIYLSATDEEHYLGEQGASGMQVERGANTQRGPRLLPSGVSAMEELAEYLNKTAITSKFIVYFDISAPHVPAGTFRLLSTPSYLAFSTTFFVMMSAGMLNPQVIRLTAPLVGLNFLFPRTLNEGPLSQHEQELFIRGMFSAVTKHVDIHQVGKPGASWIWDPIGADLFIFEYNPPKHHKPASWSYRSVNSSDTFSFRVCAAITALLGVIIGTAVCVFLVYTLMPYILRTNRDLDIAASSTYQLKFQILTLDWSVNSTFVSFPATGFLLRWAKRPKQPQFASLQISARRWPVQRHVPIIRTICDPTRLPAPPGTPDQQSFLFPARPRSPSAPKKPDPPAFNYNDYLMGTARRVVSDQKLDVGGAFQFKLEAFDNVSASGKAIDSSNWTRPVVIREDLVVTEFPLLLFKNICNTVPRDTFQYFLDMHCAAVGSAPSTILKFSNVKLALMNDAVLFAGEAETYGEKIGEENDDITSAIETLGSDSQKVGVVISTGGDEQTVVDDVFEATSLAALPGCSAPSRLKNLKTFKDVTETADASNGSDPELSVKIPAGDYKHKYLVIDLSDKDISLKTGQDLDQIVRIEAVCGTEGAGLDFSHTARYQKSWRELLKMLISQAKPVGGPSITQFHIDDELVMRDGLSPVAFMMADISITNSFISGNLERAETKTGFPKIFANVLPGTTFIWGQELVLTWELGSSQKFNIGMDARELGKNHEGEKTDALVKSNVDAQAGVVRMKVAPYMNLYNHRFACSYQATDPDTGEVLATSPQFVVMRPITLQELELGYATFCARNEMPMIPFGGTSDLMRNNGLDIVERTFSVINHYRPPLPIQDTLEPESNEFKSWDFAESGAGPPMVENGGSYVIVGNRPVSVLQLDTFEVVESTDEKLDQEQGSAVMNQVHKLESTPLTIDIPTNLFWRHDSDWSSELLLIWRLLPTFAREGYMTSVLTRHGLPKLGNFLAPMDNVIRFFLQIFLWWFQMLVLLSPVWILIVVWVWHDNLTAEFNPNMGASSAQAHLSLFNFLVNPSIYKFEELQLNAEIIYIFGVLYTFAVLALTLYGNFVHHTAPMRGFWVPLNSFVAATYALTFFGLSFYGSMALCWILMGSLVNPEELMPYAVMVVGVSIIVKSNWANLMSMKQQVVEGLASKLDIATRAIMTIFLGKAGATAAAEIVETRKSELIDYAEKVVAYLKSAETSATQLYWQGTIEMQVDACKRDSTLLLRDSPAFKAGLGEATGKNVVYSTDFVPKEFWTDAQENANDRHVIDGTRQAATNYGVVPDELICSIDLHEALAVDSLKGVDPTASDADEVQVLAKQLGLRPKTAEMVHQAFHTANNTAAAADSVIDAIVNAPLSIAPVMQNVREEEFFKLWLHTNISDDDIKSNKTEEEMRKNHKDHDIGLSTVHHFIKEMDHKELENLNATVARSLTELLDWTRIERKCAKFATDILPNQIVTQKIKRQLNPVINGSAAFKVKQVAGEKVFDKFEAVYAKDPNQFFVDCGVVEGTFAKEDNCKQFLTGAVANFRAFDGSIDQAGLLKALDWLVVPSSRATVEGPGGVIAKMYLWKDGLVNILDDLGWNKEEMEEGWLNGAWMAATDNKGVFEYEDIEEISVFICTVLADGGLWKAVMKTFCFHVNVGAYVACDVPELGLDKASELAHTIHDGDATGDHTDLNFCDNKVRWPQWVRDIWDALALPSKQTDNKGPKFLPIAMMDDFLQDLVYKPADKKTADAVKMTPMNKYPACADDLQWYIGEGGSIWQVTPDEKKCLRGIWMELYMAVAQAMDCLPNDLDLFLENLKWQSGKGARVPQLLYASMQDWLRNVYIEAMRTPGTFTLTFRQFSLMLTNYLDFEVPEDVLRVQVFTPCACVPGDDLGELRYAKDLGAALRLWIGYGLWKGAVKQVIQQLVPRGATRSMAIKLCSDEFDKLDTAGKGILQPGHVRLLLLKLLHPGLTLHEVTSVVQTDLGMAIPEREIHKNFCKIDVNGDGVLQATEFVSFIQVIMTTYFPEQIVNYMGFSTMAVLKVVTVLVLCLAGLFVAVTLVIKAFASGPIAATIHSSCSAGSSVMMKLQGDSSSGTGQAVSEIKMMVDAQVMLAVTACLGLGPTVIDELKKLFSKVL